MGGVRRIGRRRLVAVAAGVLGLSLMAAGSLTVPAFADDSAVIEAEQAPLVAGTPCTTTASSCVDLESERAWLFKNGAIVRGPVKVSSGGNGKETPIGHSLRVYRKDKDYKSTESRLPNGQPAPMPWAVFFEDGGIAFHSGSPARSSSGCIHLNPADAVAWFSTLEIGDQVQVVRASQELPKHQGQLAVAKKPEPAKTTDDSSDDGSERSDSSDARLDEDSDEHYDGNYDRGSDDGSDGSDDYDDY